MVENEFDEINIVALIIAPVAAAAELGVFAFGSGVNNVVDFSLSDVWYTLGSYIDITPALILFVLSIAGLAVQGELDRGDFKTEEYAMIAGSFAILPAIRLVGPLSSFVDSTPIVAIGLWLAITAASVWMSYTA